jgi:D-arabinose 1-dehydrogenase-like Zn-dependent alcohol dehydrogenase
MANGICRSDWHLWQGGWDWVGFVPELPAVLGHEYCGVVEEVGANVRSFEKGDRVVAPFLHGCGGCGTCAQGHQHICEDPRVAGMHYTGGMAEFTTVGRANLNLVRLPDAIPFADAAGLGCRFMTSYWGLVEHAKVGAGEWTVVYGCGGVGLAAVNIASALGSNVIAVSRTPEKLGMAKEVGAVHTITAGDKAHEEVLEYTGGGAHVAVDALGTNATWTPSFLSLRARGRLVRLGVSGQEDKGQLPLLADVMLLKELRIFGSFGMPARAYPEMLRMVESRKLTPGKLVNKRISLEEVAGELESMTDFNTVGMSVLSLE